MKTILIKLLSNSLGDTIAIMPCVDYFIERSSDNVLLQINKNFEFLFRNSFPKIKYFSEDMNFDKKIDLVYNHTKPLQTGYANQLGFIDWSYIRPKVDSFTSDRPIKNKYVSMSIHSTSQLKYWNHKDGISVQPLSPNWSELSGMIRKKGYTPVIIERDEMFGLPPFRNGMPTKAQKVFGISLLDTMNYIHHSEFFIGLSSGLSWLAHAMGKKVCMISNFTEESHEFDLSTNDYVRITNKSICHGCWNQVGKGLYFDNEDWYWCPKHKGTERQFECHTSITPQMVMDKINNWLNYEK